jgi:hypothetical protein
MGHVLAHLCIQMKRSSPLLIMVALTLAALSYGGKQAETPPSALGRAPAAILATKNAPKTTEKPSDFKPKKSGQDPVVIAEFPPLEIEEIH